MRFQVSSFRFQVLGFRFYSEKHLLFCVFFFLFSFFISLNCFSQETPKRPKIGLVLSGGGAKGFAHIGVLKVLEKAGIKIDYIGGTSMGAVVGGLYASGYSANQIDSLFMATNFDEMIQDYIPRTSKSFYEKRNDELYALSLPFNKFSIGVPIALTKGMYNYLLLARVLHKVRFTRDFNKLKIPFLCIGTNIETGDQIILNKGYLPEALTASSAFPTLFTPVEIDGKVIVDGGVANNYPIDEIRKLGADIIIGVDVQDDLKTRKDLQEATKILVQISNFPMVKRMDNKKNTADVYIKPDISSYSVISFDKGREIIDTGEKSALEVIDRLEKFGNISNYKTESAKKTTDSINVKRIEINYLSNYTRSYVIGKLDFKPGQKISYEDLKKGINKLNATQNFKSINFQLNPFENGDQLNLNLQENPNRTFLKFALHYDNLYKSAILLNLTQKKLFFRNDILSADIILGDNFRYNIDYYIDNGFYFSFGIKSRLNQFNRNVLNDLSNGTVQSLFGVTSLNIDFLDFTNQMYLQTIFAQKFQILGGIEHKLLRVTPTGSINNIDTFENSNYFSTYGTLKYDSYDNKYFPKKGWTFNSEIQTYLYSSNYSQQFNPFTIAKSEASVAITFFKKATLKLQTEAGLALGQKSVSFLNFALGGYGNTTINNFKPFYGYDFLTLGGNSYMKNMATLDYEFLRKNHLNFSANYANVENDLFERGNFKLKPKYSGYAVGYGLETIIGPIELKYAWSPEQSKGFTLVSVGFWF